MIQFVTRLPHWLRSSCWSVISIVNNVSVIYKTVNEFNDTQRENQYTELQQTDSLIYLNISNWVYLGYSLEQVTHSCRDCTRCFQSNTKECKDMDVDGIQHK